MSWHVPPTGLSTRSAVECAARSSWLLLRLIILRGVLPLRDASHFASFIRNGVRRNGIRLSTRCGVDGYLGVTAAWPDHGVFFSRRIEATRRPLRPVRDPYKTPSEDTSQIRVGFGIERADWKYYFFQRHRKNIYFHLFLVSEWSEGPMVYKGVCLFNFFFCEFFFG